MPPKKRKSKRKITNQYEKDIQKKSGQKYEQLRSLC
jgi:hypothetical protein